MFICIHDKSVHQFFKGIFVYFNFACLHNTLFNFITLQYMAIVQDKLCSLGKKI